MKLTIDISDLYVPVLSRWESVAQTLIETEKLCGELEFLTEDYRLRERAQHCSLQLQIITNALDALHHAMKKEL